MSFVRIEDRMPTGPKFAGIPSTAGWLYVAGLCYCSANLTDGFIPTAEVYKLTNEPRRVVQRAVQWLCTVHPPATQPLWHDHPQGVRVHDYDHPEYGNATRAVAELLRANRQRAGRVGGKRSVQVRKERYGTAQPEAAPEAVRFEAPEAPPLRSSRSTPASNAFEAPSRPVPPHPDPRASHAAPAPAPAREADPDDEPELPPEVLARMDLLIEAFDGHDGLLKRPLRGDERTVLLGWGHLERGGQPVPLDEIVTFARRLLATPFRDSTLPATLRAIDAAVLTLARAPAPNGVNGTGPAGERLTPNSQLARQIEAQMRERQGGQAT